MINERPVDKINNNYLCIFIAPRFIQMKTYLVEMFFISA